MSTTRSLLIQLDRVQQRSLLVGLVGLTLFIVGAFLNPQQFFRSYLVAYLFWIGISLGGCSSRGQERSP
ncbi:MAG: hypothetical protein HYU27_10490 [Acidobacteria bacterium]|nr:hypothetical protein [Acidobacteriota bacterium]